MQNAQQPTDALTQTKAMADSAVAMWRRARQQGRGPIGLDFAHSGVNAVQLHRKGEQLRIVAAGRANYPTQRSEVLHNPELLQSLLGGIFDNSQFKGSDVVVSAPMGVPKVLSLSFKGGNPKDTPRQVMELVKERLGGNDNDWLVDYLPVKLNIKNSQESTVMAAAMQRRESLLFMRNLQNAGLQLLSLEIAPQALQRLLQSVDNPVANCLVINFGHNKSYLSHFSDGNLTMDREIAVGSEDFVAPIAKSLELDSSLGRNLFYTLGFGENAEVLPLVKSTFERLRIQIERMNHYIASQLHGDGIDCIYLAGEAANWPGADRAFEAALGFQTKALNPFYLFESSSNLHVQERAQPMLSIATGLAMRVAA